MLITIIIKLCRYLPNMIKKKTTNMTDANFKSMYHTSEVQQSIAYLIN